MQDKEKVIIEIMDLVETYGEACENYGKHRKADVYQATGSYRHLIEAALRKLVEREPLSDEQMETLIEKHAPPIHPDFSEDDDFDELVRAVEAAHGITKGS